MASHLVERLETDDVEEIVLRFKDPRFASRFLCDLLEHVCRCGVTGDLTRSKSATPPPTPQTDVQKIKPLLAWGATWPPVWG